MLKSISTTKCSVPGCPVAAAWKCLWNQFCQPRDCFSLATTKWPTDWRNGRPAVGLTSCETRPSPPESEDLIVSRPTSVAGAEIADNHPGVVREGLPISAGTPAEEAVSLAAGLLIARQRSSGEPLWRAKEMPVDVQPLASRVASPHPKLVLVGHNRMTESLAELAVALDWHVTVNSPGIFSGEYPHSVCRVLDDEAYELDEVTPGSDVVIATQHKGDHRVLRSVLGRSPAYVGLIASRRRAGLIVEFLQREGLLRSARACLHTPCGLDLGARAPFEIALSIVSEIIAHRNA